MQKWKNPQAPQSCEPVETLIKVTHYYGTLKFGLLLFFFTAEKKKTVQVLALK